MAILVDATIGGASSNSYLTVARAGVLAETLPHMDAWLQDMEVNKPQLLVHATRLIDRHFVPIGMKTSDTQALMWPRKHAVDVGTGLLLADTVIPTFVEMATLEWAAALHENPDPYAEVGHGLRRLRTPSYEMEFDGNTPSLIPRVVSMLLGPYSMKASGPFHRVVRM